MQAQLKDLNLEPWPYLFRAQVNLSVLVPVVASQPGERRTGASEARPRSGVLEPAAVGFRAGGRRPERQDGGGQQGKDSVSRPLLSNHRSFPD